MPSNCSFDSLKVSEYPFKQNKNISLHIIGLLRIYFYSNSLIVLRLTFLNICAESFSCSPNIEKMMVKVGQKSTYFFYFMSSYSNRFVVFYNFFSLKSTLSRPKQKLVRVLLNFKCFFNNVLLIIFVQFGFKICQSIIIKMDNIVTKNVSLLLYSILLNMCA